MGFYLILLLCILSPLSSCHWSGGEDGAAGLNLLHRADSRLLNLGAKTSVSLQPGVRQQCEVHVWKRWLWEYELWWHTTITTASKMITHPSLSVKVCSSHPVNATLRGNWNICPIWLKPSGSVLIVKLQLHFLSETYNHDVVILVYTLDKAKKH